MCQMSHVRKLFESCRCSPVWLVLGVYRQQIDRVYLQNFLSNKTHKNTISVDLRRIFLEFLPADGKLMASEAKAAGVAWGSCEECHWRRDKWCANGSLAASWSILPQFLHTISSTQFPPQFPPQFLSISWRWKKNEIQAPCKNWLIVMLRLFL